MGRKRKQLRIYTDIEDKRLTKTAKYLFFIDLAIYFSLDHEIIIEDLQPRSYEKFDPINVYIDDKHSKDYDISMELKEASPTYLYHVLVDTRNPRFKKCLEALRDEDNKCNYFMDCYQYKSYDSNKAVIRFRVPIKKQIPRLINSEYSKLFSNNNYESLKASYSSTSLRYKILDRDMLAEELEYKETKPYGVLTKSEWYYNNILDEFNIDPNSDTARDIKNKEFDSKFNIEKETLTYESI